MHLIRRSIVTNDLSTGTITSRGRAPAAGTARLDWKSCWDLAARVYAQCQQGATTYGADGAVMLFRAILRQLSFLPVACQRLYEQFTAFAAR